MLQSMAPGLRTARMRKKPMLLVTRQRRSNQNRKNQEGRSASWTGIESKETGNNSRAEPRRSGVGSPTTTSTFINGRQDQLEGKIQERYGLAKDQAKKDVDAWFKSLP
jgi:hypothetical protein